MITNATMIVAMTLTGPTAWVMQAGPARTIMHPYTMRADHRPPVADAVSCPPAREAVGGGMSNSSAHIIIFYFMSSPTGSMLGPRMIHSLDLTKFLPAGSQCRIGAHVVPFPGDPRHRNVGYDQSSPSAIRRQADLMQDCGITFITLDWYGTQTRSQLILTGWMAEAERRGQFFVAVMADKDSDPTAPAMSFVYSSPAYLDKLLLTFPAAWSQPLPPSLRHLAHGSGFLWMELPPAGSTDTPLSILKRQYARGQTVMGAVFSGFNDSDPKAPASSVWGGPARRWDDPLGTQFLECWRAIPPGLRYVQLVTWNDFEEGTALEGTLAMLSGIRLGGG